MFFRARNGSVCIDDTDMDYVSFGKGNNTLIMLPGLADGLATVKGMALTLLGVLIEITRMYCFGGFIY